MIKLNDDLLQELGLASLPLEEKKRLLAHIYETLEMRVGMKLAQQMTDEQLDEFEQFIKANDEAGALNWLETKFPHYKDVVSAEFEALKAEIRQVAPQILAAGTANVGQSQPGMGQPQGQMPYGPQPVQSPQGGQHVAPQQQGQAWQQPQPAYPQPQQPQQPWPPQQQGQHYAQPAPAPTPQPQPAAPNPATYGYGAPQPQPMATPQQPGTLQAPQQQPPVYPQPQNGQVQPQQGTAWNGQTQGSSALSDQQPPLAA